MIDIIGKEYNIAKADKPGKVHRHLDEDTYCFNGVLINEIGNIESGKHQLEDDYPDHF